MQVFDHKKALPLCSYEAIGCKIIRECYQSVCVQRHIHPHLQAAKCVSSGSVVGPSEGLHQTPSNTHWNLDDVGRY